MSRPLRSCWLSSSPGSSSVPRLKGHSHSARSIRLAVFSAGSLSTHGETTHRPDLGLRRSRPARRTPNPVLAVAGAALSPALRPLRLSVAREGCRTGSAPPRWWSPPLPSGSPTSRSRPPSRSCPTTSPCGSRTACTPSSRLCRSPSSSPGCMEDQHQRCDRGGAGPQRQIPVSRQKGCLLPVMAAHPY